MSKINDKEEHEVLVYANCFIVRPSPLLLPLPWVLTPVQPFSPLPSVLTLSLAVNTCRLGPEAWHNFFCFLGITPDSV